MANLNAPRGFSNSRRVIGANWNGQANVYCIPQADTSIYAPGDAVVTIADGDANGIMKIAKHPGTGSVAVRGIIQGMLVAGLNNPSLQGTVIDLSTQVIPATKTKDYYVMVDDDPNSVFELQDDGAIALTASSCNKLANFTPANPAGISQNSGTVMSTTVGTDPALFTLRVMGLVQREGNAFGAFAKWLVKINNHELGTKATGV